MVVKLPKRTKKRMNNRKSHIRNKRITTTTNYITVHKIKEQKQDGNNINLKECNQILVTKDKKCNKKKYSKFKSKSKECFTNPTKKNECSKFHKCKCKFGNYMTGYEPIYNPEDWSDPTIEGSHNCYAYFLNDHIHRVKKQCNKMCLKKNKGKKCTKKINNCGDLKPQPGDYAAEIGLTLGKNRKYNCNDMVNKVILDNTDKKTKKKFIHKVDFTRKCPPHHYKGAIVVDPNNTYHFYRQDDNVRFSHKQGTMRVEDTDASKNPIYIPHLSDMNYNKDNRKNGIDYTDFCSYLCVPNNNYIKTHAI